MSTKAIASLCMMLLGIVMLAASIFWLMTVPMLAMSDAALGIVLFALGTYRWRRRG
jgi:hypothetical protein